MERNENYIELKYSPIKELVSFAIVAIICISLVGYFTIIAIYSGFLLFIIFSTFAFFFVILISLLELIAAFEDYNQIRKFRISDYHIQFKIKNLPLFQISWLDFNELEIKFVNRKLNKEKLDCYKLIFFKNEKVKDIKIRVKKDFPKSKIENILKLLKSYAKRMNKKIIQTQ
ncbi:MAG: hypothetical protein ACTSQJ_01085 [Promethearchaeota archaeon]